MSESALITDLSTMQIFAGIKNFVSMNFEESTCRFILMVMDRIEEQMEKDGDTEISISFTDYLRAIWEPDPKKGLARINEDIEELFSVCYDSYRVTPKRCQYCGFGRIITGHKFDGKTLSVTFGHIPPRDSDYVNAIRITK